MYKRAIVDELGYVVCWYDEFEIEEDVRTFLSDFPECSVKCVEI